MDERFGIWIIVAVTLAVIGVVGYAVTDYIQHRNDPTFALTKRDWTCAKSHIETIYVPMYPDGKNVIMMPQMTTICDQYDRAK